MGADVLLVVDDEDVCHVARALPATARLAARQLEREAGAASWPAVEQDSAAMRLHDVAHDRETETRAADISGLRRLREALEDALLLVGGNPGAGVAHRQKHVPVLGS